MPEITLPDIGQLLASLPSMMGFPPTNSLTVVPFIKSPGHRFKLCRPVMRVDLTHFVTAPDELVCVVSKQLADQAIDHLLLVITTDTTPSDTEDTFPHRAEVDAFIARLRDEGFTAFEAIHLPRFEVDAPWRCYHDREYRGQLPDPAATVMAALSAAEGRTTAASREQLSERFTPLPAQHRRRLEPALAEARTLIEHHLETEDLAALRARLDRAVDAVTDARHGTLPTDDAVVADLIATFAHRLLHPALLTPDDTQDALGTENLVTHLWRYTDEPDAGALAGIVAALAYCRGDGALALIAADTTTSSTLAALIAKASTVALPPSTVHDTLRKTATQVRHKLEFPTPTGETHEHQD